MSIQETAPLTAALFASKGDASAEGFVQPAASARRWFTARVRGACFVLALPVAYLVAATVAGVSLEIGGDGRARALPEFAEAVATPPPPSVIAATPRRAATPATPPAPKPASPTPLSPLKPVSVALAVPPAPPLKPLAVFTTGLPKKQIARHGPPPAARGRYRVQLASLVSAAAVRREWHRLKTVHGKVFHGLSLIVESSPSGAFYRLQAGPVTSRGAARKLCARLRRPRSGCFVVAR